MLSLVQGVCQQAHSVLRKRQLGGKPLAASKVADANETVRVAIIGAGISGLVAAWELRKRGVKINAFGVTYQTIRIADFQAMSRFSGDLCVHSG